MRTCERLVKEGRFVPSNPIGILTTSYCELLQNKVPLLGKYISHVFSSLNTPPPTPDSPHPPVVQTVKNLPAMLETQI